MILKTHQPFDTIGHEHKSMLVRADNGNDILCFMLVECRDGRYFLESEFNDDEFNQFEDVFNETRSHDMKLYPNRLAALTRALEIAAALRPTATKTELLAAIEEARTLTK